MRGPAQHRRRTLRRAHRRIPRLNTMIHRGARRGAAQSNHIEGWGSSREITSSLRSALAGRRRACFRPRAVAQRQPPRPNSGSSGSNGRSSRCSARFSRGRPADTAGFADEPAATQSSVADARPAPRRARAADDRHAPPVRREWPSAAVDRGRLRALRDRSGAAHRDARAAHQRGAAPVPAATAPAADPPKPAPAKPPKTEPTPAEGGPRDGAPRLQPRPTDRPTIPARTPTPQGFKLWEAGSYDEAITSLRAFTSAYPKHRRVELREQPHRPGAARQGRAARRGRGPARQLSQQSRRASARPTASIISARR